MSQGETLRVALVWERALDELLTLTARFPKSARHTFATRIEGLALDIILHLTVARYSCGQEEAHALRDADLALAQLRVLWRLAHERALVSHAGHEAISRAFDEAGRLLGAWRKHAPLDPAP
jgi:hypothetical protein